MVEIALIACVLVVCIGGIYLSLLRSKRQLEGKVTQLQAVIQNTLVQSQQQTANQLQNLYAATRDLLAQSQQETATLSRALRSPHQRGHWGELELQRIVELSGMVPYCDFETQIEVSGITGKRRLDLVIHLHNEHTIVVDAKVPMEAYLDETAATDDAVRATKLRQHAQHVRAHINDLAKKEYWRYFQPSPEIVVLFLPNEATFRAALEHDLTLIDLSIQQNILLASPLTLIALLKAVAYGWSQENRARSIQQIVNQSQTLHEELIKFSDQGNKLRSKLDDTVKEFNQLANAYNTKVLPVVKQLRALDSTLPDKDKVLQVSPLSRKLEEFEHEEAEMVTVNQDVEVSFISCEGSGTQQITNTHQAF